MERIKDAIEYFESEKDRLLKARQKYSEQTYWVSQELARITEIELTRVITALDALKQQNNDL